MDKAKGDGSDWVDVLKPPMHMEFINALKSNNLRVIEQLHSMNPALLRSTLDAQQTMPIHVAANVGAFDVVVFIIAAFPEQLNVQDRFGQTPLYLAASAGDRRLVTYFVDKHAMLQIMVSDPVLGMSGLTAIVKAMLNEHHQIVEILLDACEATLEEMDQPIIYDIAMKWALEQENEELSMHLILHNAFKTLELQQKIRYMGIAVEKSNLNIIKWLVQQNKALLTLADESGNLPIVKAVLRGQVDIVSYFISEGVKVDWNGKSLLLLAHEHEHYAVASLIAEKLLTISNQHTLFDFIPDADTAFEYILLAPHHAKYILRNQKIRDSIRLTGGNITSELNEEKWM